MAITHDAAEVQKRKDAYKVHTYFNVDVRLSNLLDLAFGIDDDHRDGQISLTVVTDGAVISGLAVSEDAWAEAQASDVEASSPEFAESLRIVQKASVDVRAHQIKAKKDSEDPGALRTELHFAKATIVTGGTNFVTHGMRVDLKHVSAWSLGEMVPNN